MIDAGGPGYRTLEEYNYWLANAPRGANYVYARGKLPSMRRFREVERVAYKAWLDAGGWPDPEGVRVHEALRIALQFKARVDRKTSLVQRYLGHGVYEYIAQKL